MPALDGVRALAVALVMAYHGGVAGLRVAGFYGVDVFFVLSGFLITRLLLTEHAERGRIRLPAFWGRRARRLLPGLLVMLAAVAAYVAWAAPAGRYPGFRGDALSVITYSSNWHFIGASSNYFQSTGAPSLLTHTWSLAIEEQFYLVWPLLIWGAVRLAGRIRRNPAWIVLALSGAGALGSVAYMAVLYRSGVNPSRLYYGTDTHAVSILVGCSLAALAAVVPIRIRGSHATPAAAVALGGLVWAACTLGSSDPLTYQGGFLVVSLLAALLIVVVVTVPSSTAARTLSLRPLAYLGRISYGMYLWYFLLFALIDRANTGLTGADLFVVRCTADVLVAAISFHLIEQPIRRWRPAPRPRVPVRLAPLGAGFAVIAAAVVLVVAGTPGANPAGLDSSLAAATEGPPQGSPPAAGAGALRLLVFGDSTAATLGDALVFSDDVRQKRLVDDVVPMFGCGLAVSFAISVQGQADTPPAPCRSGTPSREQWPSLLQTAIATYHPDVVLVASGRWEVESRRANPGGRWTNITQPGDAAYVRSQLEVAASVIEGSGARLALATAPCFASGEQPNGDSWPEDGANRLDAYNGIVRQVAADEAARHPGTVAVVDLDSIVCPSGKFRSAIDGVTVRAPDGIHYPFFDIRAPVGALPDTYSETAAFGAWIEPRILHEMTSIIVRSR